MSVTDEQHGQLDTGYPHTLRLELHKALMARGIDYWVAQGLTFWNCPDGRECVAYGFQANGKPRLSVKIVGITDPEQAIEATLGRGECRDTEESRWFHCSECGFGMFDLYTDGDWYDEEQPKFCPNCGRRVVGRRYLKQPSKRVMLDRQTRLEVAE